MKNKIFLILALGFLLRIWGISFGLPELYHADEPNVVNRALAYGTGDLNPHYFKIPSLVSYGVFLTYGFYFLAARALGWVKGMGDFQNLFFSDPTSFYLLARIFFGAILGTATLFVLYQLVKKWFSRDHALLASFLLACNFLHVRDCHYLYLDIPLLLTLVLCFFPIFKVLKEGERRDYFAFGILAGIAVAVKYNGVFIFAPWLVAHFLKKGMKPSSLLDPTLFLTGLVSIGVWGLLNPFSVIDFKSFAADVFNISEFEGFVGFTHHLTYSLHGGLGLPLLTLSLLGIVRGTRSHEKERKVTASFVLVYYLVLCLKSQPYDRYVLPLIPFLIILASDFLISLKVDLRAAAPVWWILALPVIAPSLLKIYYSNVLFSNKDIRQVAREWIEVHIPPETKIALDVPFFLPRLRPSLVQLEEKRGKILSDLHTDLAKLKRVERLIEQAKKNASEPRYQLYYLKERDSKNNFLFSKPEVAYSVEALKEFGIAYVVVAKIKESFKPRFYTELAKKTELLSVFSPYKDKARRWSIDDEPLTGGPFLWRELISRERNGQVIEVYRLKRT